MVTIRDQRCPASKNSYFIRHFCPSRFPGRVQPGSSYLSLMATKSAFIGGVCGRGSLVWSDLMGFLYFISDNPLNGAVNTGITFQPINHGLSLPIWHNWPCLASLSSQQGIINADSFIILLETDFGKRWKIFPFKDLIVNLLKNANYFSEYFRETFLYAGISVISSPL